MYYCIAAAAPSPLCAPVSPSHPPTASAGPGHASPQTRQIQTLRALSVPRTPSTTCAAQSVGAGNQFHRVLYPSQLHQAEEFQWAGAEPGGTQIVGHCGVC